METLEWRTIEGVYDCEVNMVGEVRRVSTGAPVNIIENRGKQRFFKVLKDNGEESLLNLNSAVQIAFGDLVSFRVLGDKKVCKTTVQTIENTNFDKERFGMISLDDYKTEAIVIASRVVSEKFARLNMYEMDDLKGYLTEKALMIVEKFDPTSTKNGWKDLGSFLFFTLSNHAKNFNQQYFNYLKGIAPMETKEQNTNQGESPDIQNPMNVYSVVGADDTAYEDVEFFADNILGELLELLTPRQKFILKGKLDLKNNVEIASELGTTKMTVGRDLKKIQEIATDIGIAI